MTILECSSSSVCFSTMSIFVTTLNQMQSNPCIVLRENTTPGWRAHHHTLLQHLQALHKLPFIKQLNSHREGGVHLSDSQSADYHSTHSKKKITVNFEWLDCHITPRELSVSPEVFCILTPLCHKVFIWKLSWLPLLKVALQFVLLTK